MLTLENTVHYWLKLLNINIPKSRIDNLLLAHPLYPSLASITDSLDNLGIENASLRLNSREKLADLPTPYLVHLITNGGEVKAVKTNPYTEIEEFDSVWSGIVLVAEKNSNRDKKDSKFLSWNKSVPMPQIIFGLGVLLFALTSLAIQPAFSNLVLVLVAVTGIIISSVIIQKELGIEGAFADKFCVDASCEKSIVNNDLKLPFGITPGDMAISWFSFLLLNVTFSQFLDLGRQFDQLFGGLAVIGAVIALLSFYHQYFVSRAWCKLCLVISTILLIQLVIAIPFLSNVLFWKIEYQYILFSFFLFFTLFMGGLLIKKNFKKQMEWKKQKHAYSRLRYDWGVFNVILGKQKKYEIGAFENEIIFGDVTAKTQLLGFISITCSHCGDALKSIYDITEKFGADMYAIIRFKVPHSEMSSQFQALQYILSVLATRSNGHTKYLVLRDWYTINNPEYFKKKYPNKTDLSSVNQLLQNLKRWNVMSGNDLTPSLFINGRLMPFDYSIEEFNKLLEYYPDKAALFA